MQSTTPRPNILFLMTDQMQAAVLEPDHPCITPNFDRLAKRGVRLQRAYTPSAVCSPARASLMTGLLPHNHGVLSVIHTMDDDQLNLRSDKPHWAQSLAANGYRTGYFGKWHVERSNDVRRFGWQVDGTSGGEISRVRQEVLRNQRRLSGQAEDRKFTLSKNCSGPEGYRQSLFYGVTTAPPEERGMGLCTSLAEDFVREVLNNDSPWCCFVSVTEPHDPFIAGEAAFSMYDVEALVLPPNAHDDLQNRPGLYRKAARIWSGFSEREKKEAAACYYASITEIDTQFGRLLDRVERAGKLDNTIVVLTTDHGEMLGAHALYCKNITASEAIYNIPLIVSGPGVASDIPSSARVGLHDVGPTLLELTGCDPIETACDSRSFASVLRDPTAHEGEFTLGYAEYFGTRFMLTQRVVWDGIWKLVINGFDFDELYNLETDPHETTNLAAEPAHEPRLRTMTMLFWKRVQETGDHTLLNTHYPILRIAPYGPMILDDPQE